MEMILYYLTLFMFQPNSSTDEPASQQSSSLFSWLHIQYFHKQKQYRTYQNVSYKYFFQLFLNYAMHIKKKSGSNNEQYQL